MSYRYSPFHDKPVWSGAIFIKVSGQVFTSLVDIMLSMKQYQDSIANRQMSIFLDNSQLELFAGYQTADEYAGRMIAELRIIAHGYYEHWILRHMIRVVITLIFGADPLEFWAYRHAMKLQESFTYRS